MPRPGTAVGLRRRVHGSEKPRVAVAGFLGPNASSKWQARKGATPQVETDSSPMAKHPPPA
jgi:hypothetical protein